MEALLQIYNPHTDSQALKARPEFFEQLRGNYPIRHEEQAYEIKLKQ
jgi:erythronate-4-phosphate dehydrogenase